MAFIAFCDYTLQFIDPIHKIIYVYSVCITYSSLSSQVSLIFVFIKKFLYNLYTIIMPLLVPDN